MPINERDYMREKHPPACTCVSCEKHRLAKYKKSASEFQKPFWKRIIGKLIPWL